MTNLPVFSVVIPAYNAAKTLRATVQSALKQTFDNLEIIIVDDGSTDSTFELANSISDTRIKVISKTNGGVANARNTGIRLAKGKLIALLDADDLWVPHKLECQLKFLQAHENVGAIQSGAYFVNNSLEILSVRPCFKSKDALLETLLFQNLPNAMSTTVFKKDVLEKTGYFDANLSFEDWEFMIRLARFCNLQSIEEPLSLYRVHEGNRSKDLSIHIESGDKILARFFDDETLPARIKRREKLIYSTLYRMICGGALNAGLYKESIKWGMKSLAIYPRSIGYMTALPLRKMQRKSSRTTISKEQLLMIEELKGINNNS